MTVDLLNKRLIIVAGKGGVGKTVVSTALGMAAARRGKRVIIVEMASRSHIGSLFGDLTIDYEPVQLHPNLFASFLTPQGALQEYGLRKLKFKRVFKIIFENDIVKKMLNIIPGMHEMLLLGKALDLVRERDRKTDSHLWDMVIVDSPATGHGILMFRLPHVVLEAVDKGPMAEDMKWIRAHLMDPEITAMNIVSLAEEMPFNETLELWQQQNELLRIPGGYLFVNAVLPKVFVKEEINLFARMLQQDDALAPLGVQVSHITLNYALRRRLQEEYLNRFQSAIPLPKVELPYIFHNPFEETAIEQLSTHIETQVFDHTNHKK